MGFEFDAADRRRLEERGIELAEARRQLESLRAGMRPVELVRPCTVEDGVFRLADDELPELIAGQAAAVQRCWRFIPAAGAATRMFGPLAGLGEGQTVSAEALEFVRGLARFQNLPKALIPFHDYPEGGRTAFEEHLVEAALCAADPCRLHFAVGAEHLPIFQDFAARHVPAYERRLGTRLAIDFSVQQPSTDTLALDAAGRPARDAEGRLLLRPAGHGALIWNLGRPEFDLLCIKNVDNVQPDRLKPEVARWKQALVGLLVRLEGQAHRHLASLRDPREETPALDRASDFVRTWLAAELDPLAGAARARRAFLIDRLDRPWRVCGVVQDTGEPGGGPFWVRGRDGALSVQIVEDSQVDREDLEQQRIFAAATHFNPVDLVCSVRDAAGRPFDLSRFVDHDASILTCRVEGGQTLRALERPGLWNGAMAGWNTVFVEVPASSFSPVKTVLDLLREAHRTSSSSSSG